MGRVFKLEEESCPRYGIMGIEYNRPTLIYEPKMMYKGLGKRSLCAVSCQKLKETHTT